MPRIEWVPEALDDVDRTIEHQVIHATHNIPERIGELLDALQVLTHSPGIGRPARAGRRELVIGRQGRGYVALYRHVPELDTVFVLAVRSQREGGYR